MPCNCVCHTPGLVVKHVIACCVECPKCHQRVRTSLEDHSKTCRGLDDCFGPAGTTY